MDPNEAIKQEIKQHMKQRGVKQKSLADDLGLKPAAVSNILNGDRRVISGGCQRILEALGLEIVVVQKGDA